MNVVVLNDSVPFPVKVQDVIRISGEGIPDSIIQINIIEGPIEIKEVNEISNVFDGKVLSGPKVREFVLKPTGVGKVKAEVNVNYPQPGTESKKTTFEFEIQ